MPLAMLAAWVSWVVWFALMGAMAAYEVFAVLTERTTGALPLTRILRDRLMRHSTFAKVGMLLFLTWLWVHFITPLNW